MPSPGAGVRGEVAEWLKAHAWKVCLRETVTRVRIPLSPPRAGISQATYFNWKKKYDGLLPTEMKRLKQLEDENGKLRKLVADLSLDKEMLQDVIRRNVWSAPSMQGFWVSKRAQSA